MTALLIRRLIIEHLLMNTIFLLLGGNLGDKGTTLQNAMKLISEQIGEVEKTSSVYETKAWGVKNQPDFYNQVVQLKTKLAPLAALMAIQSVEIQLGRTKRQKWHARIIDIDILYYGNQFIGTDVLRVPHSQMHNRNFALYPLNEIAPDFIHPILKKTTTQLLEECKDNLPVKKLELQVSNG